MIKILIKVIEDNMPVTVIRNRTSVGVDTASRTGICLARSTDKDVVLDYSFLAMTSSNKYHKYNTLIDHMQKFIVDGAKIDIVVVEETFFSTNAKVFQFLSRIGGMVYTVAHLLHIKEKVFIAAVSSRKALGLPTNKKKHVVHEAFHDALPNVKIEDIDIIDGIILALNGLTKPKGLI